MKNLAKNMNVKLAAPPFVYGGHCSDTLLLIVDRIVKSAPVSLSSGSVLLLFTVLQIFVILLTVALCCCLIVFATRGRTYTVNGRRSTRRRAAAATLSAFQARTSALGLGTAGPLAIPNRPAVSTSHRVPG
ncbi:hypothetical protein niasHT_024992 [Heterodera trifolii]|uniref:Uncharacterized protein n=1 Tax=Heterodera trifolii TaxID=157864 RepID=A0ABD2KSL9_9BILA